MISTPIILHTGNSCQQSQMDWSATGWNVVVKSNVRTRSFYQHLKIVTINCLIVNYILGCKAFVELLDTKLTLKDSMTWAAWARWMMSLQPQLSLQQISCFAPTSFLERRPSGRLLHLLCTLEADLCSIIVAYRYVRCSWGIVPRSVCILVLSRSCPETRLA